jgi:hypothetical protein
MRIKADFHFSALNQNFTDLRIGAKVMNVNRPWRSAIRQSAAQHASLLRLRLRDDQNCRHDSQKQTTGGVHR